MSASGTKGRKRASIIENVHIEAVLHVVVAHEAEHVVINVTEKVDLKEVSNGKAATS